MSDRQQVDGHEIDPGSRESSTRHDSSARAADQLDRLVENERETERLVSGLGEADEPSPATADSSRARLRAMTAPPHDAGQIDDMTDAAARVRPEVTPRRRQPWWRRATGRLPRND